MLRRFRAGFEHTISGEESHLETRRPVHTTLVTLSVFTSRLNRDLIL